MFMAQEVPVKISILIDIYLCLFFFLWLLIIRKLLVFFILRLFDLLGRMQCQKLSDNIP